MSAPYNTRSDNGHFRSLDAAAIEDAQIADPDSHYWQVRAAQSSAHLKQVAGCDQAKAMIDQFGQDNPDWTYKSLDWFCIEKIQELEHANQ